MLNYDKTKPLIALIVPTGIGASIGGYAGDASQIAQMEREYAQRKASSYVDCH